MTIQESVDDILARLKHALLQRERAAREWERQSNQWEQRWRDVTGERDRIMECYHEAAHDAAYYRETLDFLYGAVLNGMTSADLPHEWAAGSAMDRASKALDDPPRADVAATCRAALGGQS